MWISDFSISKPMVTIVSMVALVVFGIISLLRLDTDEFPEVTPPIVVVSIPYPGAAPETVEREVLEPIEEAITGISGVDQISGTATDGFAQIIVEFLFEKDLKEATQDIRDQISGIRADLPQEMEEPILRQFNPTDRPIVSLALSSKALTPAQLTRLADPGIVRELRSLPGVADVLISGDIARELTVELDPQKLAAAGVSVAQVVGALQSQNLAAPVGRLTTPLDERTVRLQGRMEHPDEFAQLVVATIGGRQVRLSEVATVRDGTEEARSVALFNDREAVGIDIKKSASYSTTDVSARVQQRVARLQQTLPEGTELTVVRDAGVRVENSVENVQETLIEGALLTVLVVFIFLNSWRSTVITGLALPVSVLASFIAVWAFDFTLNTMSLLGLSLAIGILIDDAIVVRENIVRHIEMGKDHITAAREGTAEIGLAVAATTFAIIAVFVPIAFQGDVSGQWFKPFALTIACSVLVSLFVSFSLDPMLSAYWPDPHVPEERKSWLTKALDRFNAGFNSMAGGYRRVIAWSLDHPVLMFLIATASFVGALALPATGLVGSAFFPGDDRSEINIGIETPPGSSLAYTRLKAEEVVRLARAHAEVRYAYTTVGDALEAVDKANVYLALVKPHERSMDADAFAARMRAEVRQVGGATVSVFTNDFQGDQKQIQLQLRGNDQQALNQAAELLLAEVRQVPGVVDVGLSTKGQKPEVAVELNRGLAGALGVTVGQVAQSLRPAFAGIDAGDWIDPSGETRDVTVRLKPEARERISDLARLPLTLPGPTGTSTLPLGQVATLTQGLGPAQIQHLDREKVVVVQANAAGRALSEVLRDINARVQPLPLPPGVRLTQGGEAEDQGEVFGNILVALASAVLLMYLILVLQFQSFLDPLAIMTALPLSLIGVMLGLMVGGMTINIMSMIGVILLMGIVAKNSILLIDFAKWAKEERGLPIRDALIEAGATRLRPILMTTIALIAGMVPVAIGAGEGAMFRRPLGAAVIGGVITSTLLTLLVIPTIYEVFDRMRGYVNGFFRRHWHPASAPPPHPHHLHGPPATAGDGATITTGVQP
jgi:HAE1 family hydrophobic/amphiphilic exporter-1